MSKQSNLERRSHAALIALTVSAMGTSALAAESETSAKESNETTNPTELTPISVVGHKLTEFEVENNAGALGERDVLDTPFSVDVISLEDMQIRQVNTLDSLFSREASVSIDGSAYANFGSTARVRGLPLDYTNSFKINGLSINNFSGELPYEAFEQVTLLKGSTGFMYGMVAPGGVVNYVTKKPEKDLLSIDVGHRTDSVFSAHVDTGTRFGADDQHGLRINLVKEDGDTYLEGGSVDRETVSIAFSSQITDSLQWNVDLIHNDRRVESSWNVMNNSMDPTEPLPDAVSGDRNIGVDGTFEDHKNLIALTSLNWDFDDNWSVRFEYDYSENDTRWVKTLAYLLNAEGDVDIALYDQYFDVDYEQFQALVHGRFATGPLKHSITVGAAYQESTTYRNDPNRLVTRGYGTDNLYDPVDLPTYNSTLPEDLSVAWTDEQQSLFVNDFIGLTERWELLLGLRYNSIEHLPSEYFSTYHDDYDDSIVTPVAAIMFKPNARSSVYLSYVESFEGQTSAVSEGYDNAGDLLPPLESTQYELGLKSAGDGWSVSSALFRIERGAEILQDNRIVQDGVTLYQGLELSAAMEVSTNLSLYGDVMLLDTEYDKMAAGDPTQGNDVAGAPENQVTLQANYDVSALPGLALNFGGKHHGKTKLDAANVWEIPAYDVLYAGASYTTRVGSKTLTLIGTVDNLLDEEYWAVGDAYGGLRFGEAQIFALKAKLDF